MATKQVAETEKREMPRERLERLGAAALSDKELMAILLRTGCRDKSVFELADELTKNGRIYKDLVHVNTVAELQNVKGLGMQKITTLLATMELGRRIAKRRNASDDVVVSQPGDVYTLLAPDLRDAVEEHFCVLLLNNKGKVLAQREVTRGTLTGSLVHPREVYKYAVAGNAAKIIVVHNHPSGDSAPSREDRNVTKMLKDAGEIMGIELVDHIIIGDGNYYSFSDSGTL